MYGAIPSKNIISSKNDGLKCSIVGTLSTWNNIFIPILLSSFSKFYIKFFEKFPTLHIFNYFLLFRRLPFLKLYCHVAKFIGMRTCVDVDSWRNFNIDSGRSPLAEYKPPFRHFSFR
jgi:hypothetical protein